MTPIQRVHAVDVAWRASRGRQRAWCQRKVQTSPSRPVVGGDANARLVIGTASGWIASQEQAMTSNRKI
jgi:hypothetical protein